MKSDENILELAAGISSDFSKQGLLINKKDFDDLNELKLYLIKKMEELLENNYDKLINALYLIDVNEEKLKVLFSNENKEYIPPILADLIIERQLQKLSFRKMYREGKL